ncbi:DUF2617 family protein [Staphylococcus chromogenes]|nr:DUF2617 family protein [Staphylococcus chromogenes]
MLVELGCRIADVSAHRLGLQLDGPQPEILSEVELVACHAGVDTQLQLGVIGASHVATVQHAGRQFREEISCHASGALPRDYQQPSYQLHSELLQPRDFAAYAEGFLRLAQDWHIAQFPGEGRFHLTALTGQFAAGTWQWETRHFYPEEGLIVSTESRFKL